MEKFTHSGVAGFPLMLAARGRRPRRRLDEGFGGSTLVRT
jgi:hypothetical protein